MTLLENKIYVPADITDKENDVKIKIDNFVESLKGSTEDEQRINLPIIKKMVQKAVSYVMLNLPTGVDRVDGACIRPLLNEVVDGKINALPVIEEEPPEE